MRKISVEALKNKITKVVSEEKKEDERWAAGLRYALTIIDEVIDESEGK